METYNTEKSLLSTLITWTIVIVAIIVGIRLVFWLLGLVMGVVGAVVGIVTFLAFTVLPIIIVGWLIMKAFGYVRNRQTV